MTYEQIQFCRCKSPTSNETAIIDSTEYETCLNCGLPIESTGTAVEDED